MANQLTRWNPFREMATMQNMIDRLFEDYRPFFDQEGFTGGFNGHANTFAHALSIDVHEDSNGYTITTELPGVKSENINVRQDGDTLLIEANIPEETTEEQDKRYLIRERRSGHFSRRIRLPQHVNYEQAEAMYNDGVLTLTLPKSEEAKPRQIPVKTGNGNGQHMISGSATAKKSGDNK